MTIVYKYDEALKQSIDYFGGEELPAKVFLDKYALRDNDLNLLEATPDDMFERIASEIARIEKDKFKKPLTKVEIKEYLKGFKRIIPQGSPMYGIGNKYQYVSLSNCFAIKPPVDSYGGICKADQEIVQISKRRGGVGTDLSNLRPAGSATTNAAKTSTGILSFMDRYSRTIREVGQFGRRGALLLSLSIHHPEVVEFATVKKDLTKITGANISIRLSDEFLEAVKKGTTYEQRFPVDSKNPKISKQVDAREVWMHIIKNAHAMAEPGILFWDRIIRESPADCYSEQGFSTISTNPCIVGETLISVADGRNAVSIKKLADQKKDIPVYSVDPQSGQVQIKMGRNPRKTGNKKEVWKLVLDDGSSLIATSDHKILIKELKYVNLKDLKEGQSIVSFNSFENNGYRQICYSGKKMVGGAIRNRRQYRLIHEFYNGNIDAKNFEIHHKDFVKTNDNIQNLKKMMSKEHKNLHTINMMGLKNPYHKISNEWKFNFASHPGEKNSRYINVTNKELVKHGKKIFKKMGKLSKRMWIKYASDNNLPQNLSNNFRFSNFSNFKNQVCENHKVISVEFYGYDDVYNIIVDDNHNYCIINSFEDSKYVVSSGISVKNCGEVPLCPDDSCRLLLLNLLTYVKNPFTKKAYFDYVEFRKDAKIAQRMQDDIIDLEIESLQRIVNKIKKDPEEFRIKELELNLWQRIIHKAKAGRRTGTGITALGDALAALGIKYGSPKSIVVVGEIYKTLKLGCYESSIEMAQELGPFEIWDPKLEKNNSFLLRIKDEEPELYKKMQKYGRRHIALLTTAPAGSSSIETQTSAGIECLYEIFYKRRKKINQNDEESKVDYIDEIGDEWQEFDVFHPTVKKWMEITGETDVTKSPWYGCCAYDINWRNRVKLQAEANKHVDHSISSTINLPEDVSVEEVAKIYEMAWESGCKGITVYRKNSRTGVLIDNTKEEKTASIIKNQAPKRPPILKCDIYNTVSKGEPYFVFVGLFGSGNEPYEVFAGKNENLKINIKTGNIKKLKRGKYSLLENNGEVVLESISENISDDQEAITRLISSNLRHGCDVSFIVHQLEKVKGDLLSFAKALSRVLKKYIPDNSRVHGEACKECGAELVRIEGCVTCRSCGFSRC